jgi:hypothetical protein
MKQIGLLAFDYYGIRSAESKIICKIGKNDTSGDEFSPVLCKVNVSTIGVGYQ